MSCYHSIVFILTFAVLCSVRGNLLISRPSLVTREGENAELPCLTSGEGDILTWRKGYNFSSSEFVASLNGENNLMDRGYVSANGSLHIFNLTQDDHGNYFCRKASKTYDCNVDISLLVQDRRSSIFIDQCQPRKDCVLFTDDSEQTSTLTCTALFVSHQTVLKWFNREKQLNSEEKIWAEINSTSINISSTTTASFGDRVNLQCFAFDESIGKIDGMSAYVQIETEHSNTYLIVSIYILAATLLVVLLCFGGFVCFKWRKDNRKRQEEGEETVPLTKKVSKRQLQVQLNEALMINHRLKCIAEKVDPWFILRLEDDKVAKDRGIPVLSSLSSVFWGEKGGIEQELKTLTGVDCVLERGSLDQCTIHTDPVKDLLKNSVYGWNSCIILNFESEDEIVKSLQNVCTGLYDIIQQMEAKGFQIENKMTFTKLEGDKLTPALNVAPEVIESLKCAEDFIAVKDTKDLPIAVEFHLSYATNLTSIYNLKGRLKVVVLKDINKLESAVGIRGCKLVDSQQCKTLIVVDGSLGEDQGKRKIRDILKQIKGFRNN